MFNPQPKQPKRGPKPRKPIARRTPLSRRSPLQRVSDEVRTKQAVTDPASFRQADIAAVFAPSPLCLFTLASDPDLHHILSRGELFGIGPRHERRSIFSSPLNAAPLSRAIHQGPKRDNPHMRRMFLEEARTRSLNAAALGAYTLTDDDRAFMQVVDQLLADLP